jgi:hypothetical protein
MARSNGLGMGKPQVLALLFNRDDKGKVSKEQPLTERSFALKQLHPPKGVTKHLMHQPPGGVPESQRTSLRTR